MVDESSPSSKGEAGSYHRNQPSFGSLPDDGYGSEGGSFSGRDSYTDDKDGGLRGYDYDSVGYLSPFLAGSCTGAPSLTEPNDKLATFWADDGMALLARLQAQLRCMQTVQKVQPC